MDASDNVYVTDEKSRRVQVYDSTGTFLRLWGGTAGNGDAQFSSNQGPGGITVDTSGNVYVTDPGNHRILEFTNQGIFIGYSGKCKYGANCDGINQRSLGFSCTYATCSPQESGSADAQFLLPSGIAHDGLNNIYVADSANYRIQKFSSAGVFSTRWGSRGSAHGEFARPAGIATDSSSHIVVADTDNDRLQTFTDTGELFSVAGADIRMSAVPGAAPGVVEPIVLLPSEVRASKITIESLNNFEGTIKLAAECCSNFHAAVSTPPAGITVQLSSDEVRVPLNGSATVDPDYHDDRSSVDRQVSRFHHWHQ